MNNIIKMNRKTIFFKTGREYFWVVITMTFLILMGSEGCKPKSTVKQHESEKIHQGYSVCNSFDEMLKRTDLKFFQSVRISPVGTKKKPMYHGFFYYNHTPSECLQFEPTGRYLLGMRVFFEGREVKPTDIAEVGYFDLKDNNKWTKIGQTTAWHWQQGCRLQWLPGFEEIVWNDRSADGKSFISQVYNIKTKKTRTLPFTVYSISPDGKTAVSVNFERIWHRGCKYVGIEDPFANQWAPKEIGLWKMDMQTGDLKLIASIKQMAEIMYPDGFPEDTAYMNLYFFRAGFNPSGNRLIVFMKDYKNKWGVTETRTEAYSMNPDGTEIRYFYKEPSHHYWFNDEELIDNGVHMGPDGKISLGYYRFKDDGTGLAKERIYEAPNGHVSLSRDNQWLLTDASDGNGYIYLYLYHFPSKKIIPLAKLETQIGGYIYPTGLGALRVDLHPRFSHDGKTISFDSTHEGYGRQIYIMDISSVIDNPPK